MATIIVSIVIPASATLDQILPGKAPVILKILGTRQYINKDGQPTDLEGLARRFPNEKAEQEMQAFASAHGLEIM